MLKYRYEIVLFGTTIIFLEGIYYMKQASKRVLSIMIAILLLIFSSVSVFAAESPTAGPDINVKVNPTQGGTAVYTYLSGIGEGENGGTIVKLEAKANDGYRFSYWKIQGEYIILEGSLDGSSTTGNHNTGFISRSFSMGYTIKNTSSLNDESLIIEAFTDIIAIPYFVKDNGSGDGSSSGGSSSGGSSNTPIDSNTSSTSPQTGDNTLLFFAGAIVIAVACSVIVVKRKIDKIEK